MKSGFHVDYQEMRPYYLDVTAWISTVTEVLDSLDTHFQDVVDEEGLQGEAAKAIKAYIAEFHQPLIAGIKLLLEQFHDRLLLYIDDYYTQVDDATDTYLDEEVLKSHLEMIESRKSMLATCQEEIMAAMEGIGSFSGISAPQRSFMEDAEQELAAKINRTMENVWLVEESHRDATEETETLLSSLNSLMQSFVWQVDKRGSGYRVGSLSENAAYREFGHACELAGMEQVRMAEALEEVRKREYERRAVELRIEESNEKIMMGLTAAGIGLETIFLAPRAPLKVLGYLMRASGSISTGYGLSEGAEGWQGLALGVAGDYLTDTDNFVCDVFFGGDKEAYHAVGRGSMYVSGVLSLGTEGYHVGRAAMQKADSFKNWLTNLLRAGDDAGSNTGTIWDNIGGTADNMLGTEIPATFKIDLDDNINYINPETGTNTLWTSANATEHMGEYVGRFGKESWSIGVRSQAMLESYSVALNQAMSALSSQTPGRYFATYGNWELGINTQTGVVYHARMLY